MVFYEKTPDDFVHFSDSYKYCGVQEGHERITLKDCLDGLYKAMQHVLLDIHTYDLERYQLFIEFDALER
jgi:hypothetical protein